MKKTSKLRMIGWIVLFCLIWVIGVLCGKLITVPGVAISKEVNPLHGVSILSSIFIAIYIALILDKHKECKKIQRELVFRRIDEIYENIASLYLKLENKSINLTEANLVSKRIWTLFDSLKKLIEMSNICSIKGFDSSFREKHKELKNLMTNTPIDPTEYDCPPIKVEDGIVKYSQSRVQEIESCIDSLKSCIFELQITITNQ